MNGQTDAHTAVEQSGVDAAQPPAKRKWWKPVVLIAVVLALFAAALSFDLGAQLKALRGWIDGLGVWGPLVFVLVYIGATVAMIPGTGPTAIAGGLFGSLWGTIIVSIGSTLGAAACFLIARYFARDAVAEWLKGSPKFQKLDQLTDTHGGWIVAITRLVPVFPFNVLNYGFGLTSVRFWTYVLFSWLCMLPGTAMYVVGTDAIVKAFQRGEVPWLLIGVVITLIALLSAVGYFARGKLRAAEREAGVSTD